MPAIMFQLLTHSPTCTAGRVRQALGPGRLREHSSWFGICYMDWYASSSLYNTSAHDQGCIARCLLCCTTEPQYSIPRIACVLLLRLMFSGILIMSADAMANLNYLLEVVYGPGYNDTWLNPTADPAAVGSWTARLQSAITDSSPGVRPRTQSWGSNESPSVLSDSFRVLVG